MMGKKLTEGELRIREVRKVVSKIRNFEKIHSEDIIKSACYIYNKAIQDRKIAERDMICAKEKLLDAERRLL